MVDHSHGGNGRSACFRLFKLGHHPFSRAVKGSIDAMRYRFLAQRFFLAASNRRFVRFLISAAL
jgi:hypothetical protein